MTERTSFFQEAPGVYSMVRLVAFVLALGCVVLVVAIAAVALRSPEHAAGVVGALTAPLATLAGGIWAALKVRTT